MTIKDFSKLCGCNPQTLRYYDREGLLKPVKVDEWSGYRYYDEEQAIAFVKIKNLQKAGFSIDEIKDMKQAVLALRDTLKDSMEKYSPVEEFGITEDECEEIKKNLDEYFGAIVKSEEHSIHTNKLIPRILQPVTLCYYRIRKAKVLKLRAPLLIFLWEVRHGYIE